MCTNSGSYCFQPWSFCGEQSQFLIELCHVLFPEYNHIQEELGRRERRETTNSFTIEVGIFLDEIFWTILENDFNANTTEEKIYMVALKWNGVNCYSKLHDL